MDPNTPNLDFVLSTTQPQDKSHKAKFSKEEKKAFREEKKKLRQATKALDKKQTQLSNMLEPQFEGLSLHPNQSS
jgi:hypothetical protein